MRLDPKAGTAKAGLRELAGGIDALYVSGRADLPGMLLQDLSAWRETAAAAAEPVQIELMGELFTVSPRAWGRYPYMLRHTFGQVGFTESVELPSIRIQPRSEHLHSVGAGEALDWWRDLMESLVGSVYLAASRLDLYSDWQGWSLGVGDAQRFVCRARRRDTHEEGDAFTGFEFGRRKTKTVAARIYDKSLQVQSKGLDWWPVVWGDSYDPTVQVLRVEFEFGRAGLREFGIDSAQAAIDRAPQLWASATERWLSYRRPTSDETRSRWPVAEEWRSVQLASLRGEAAGLDRIRRARQAGSVRMTMPALAGYVAKLAALVGCEDIEDTMSVLPGHLRDYGIWTGKSFRERVEIKRLGLA